MTSPGRGVFVGRATELDRLRGLVAQVAAGRGASALVVGEPGIGKSALVAAGVAGAAEAGCRQLRAVGDELSQPFPLRVLAQSLGEESLAVGGGQAGDPVPAAVERLLAHVDRLCAVCPVVFVLDDLQWADEASLLAWHRMHRAVGQLPLLLVAASRPVPRRPEVDRLHRRLAAEGTLLRLEPLPGVDVLEAAERMLGATLGPRLRRMVERSGGNPLYLREIIDALLREGSVRTRSDVVAEVDIPNLAVPASLAEAVAGRLEFLSPGTGQVLRLAALLGIEFSVAELAVVLGRPVTDLIDALEEARLSGVLIDSGTRLAFRHPLIRQALYGAIPGGLRSALHHQAGRALAGVGAPVEQVARQLHACDVVDDWLLDWLLEHVPELAGRAPQIAADLLERAVAHGPSADPRQPELATLLAELYLRLDQAGKTLAVARRALGRPVSTAQKVRLTWALAYQLIRGGDFALADAAVRAALDDPALSAVEAARLAATRSLSHTYASSADKDSTVADRALEQAERCGDGPATALALHSLTLLARSTDNTLAVAYADRGLALLGNDPISLEVRPALLYNRAGALDSLGRTEEADEATRVLTAMADSGEAPPRLGHQLRLPGLARAYGRGRWDDAVAGLDTMLAMDDDLPSKPYVIIFARGLAATLAAHRDDRATAERHIAAAPPARSGFDRDNAAYLMRAQAMLAERAGNPRKALDIIAPVLDADFAGTVILSDLLYPDVVRLARLVGDDRLAEAGTLAAEAVARGEPEPQMVARARRCQGLRSDDPVPLAAAVEYYRSAGRRPDLAGTLAATADVQAVRGDQGAARAAFVEALEIYDEVGAAWDQMLLEARMRALGVRRSTRGRPRGRRPTTGWEALTPTEDRVAAMVATGLSNPDIAAELYLSRRTIQTHVSRILTKLNAPSRREIARIAAARQPA